MNQLPLADDFRLILDRAELSLFLPVFIFNAKLSGEFEREDLNELHSLSPPPSPCLHGRLPGTRSVIRLLL